MAKHNGKIGGTSETMTIDCRYADGQITCPSDYKDISKQYEEKGFDIPFARSYLVKQDGKNVENIEMHVKLPYTHNGQEVWGYAVVDCNEQNRVNKNLRQYNTCEIWLGEPDKGGRNIEDVYPNTHRNMTLTDASGKSVDIDTFRLSDEVGIYAAASSNYPHVCTWKEYEELKTPSNARLGLGPVTEEGYMRYLDNCRGLMRDCKFIGDVRTPDGIDERSLDTPSSQAFLDEMAKEEQEKFMRSVEEFGWTDGDGNDNGPQFGGD